MATTLPTANASTATAQWQVAASGAQLTLAGHLNAHTLGDIWHAVRGQQTDWLDSAGAGSTLTIDLREISYLDGAGIAFLIDLQHAQDVAGGKTTLQHLDARYQPLMAQYHPFENLYPPPVSNHRPHTSLVERIGKSTEAVTADARNQVVFVGQLASNLG